VEQIKPNRIFLLSPAYAGGERARMILSERAQFDLARRLRSRERATLGEVFAFLSDSIFAASLPTPIPSPARRREFAACSLSRRRAVWSMPRPE